MAFNEEMTVGRVRKNTVLDSLHDDRLAHAREVSATGQMCDRNGTPIDVGDAIMWEGRKMLLYVQQTDRSIVKFGFSVATSKKAGGERYGYVGIKEILRVPDYVVGAPK